MPNEVRWIRITTGMFDDEKIRIIESMPDADTLLIIWIKLICHAGKINDHGNIYLAENIPYSEAELATVLNRPVNTVKLALATFTRLRMIEIDDSGVIFLINFAKNQNTIGLDKLREQTRKRVAEHRQRKKVKLLPQASETEEDDVTLRNVTVTQQRREEKNKRREEKNLINKWNNALDFIKGNVTESNYRNWFEGTIPIEINERNIVIGVRNEQQARYLERNLAGLVQRAIYREFQNGISPQYILIAREENDGRTNEKPA